MELWVRIPAACLVSVEMIPRRCEKESCLLQMSPFTQVSIVTGWRRLGNLNKKTEHTKARFFLIFSCEVSLSADKQLFPVWDSGTPSGLIVARTQLTGRCRDSGGGTLKHSFRFLALPSHYSLGHTWVEWNGLGNIVPVLI